MELDEATLARAQEGDRTAQTAFLRRYAGPLRSLVRRLGRAADLEDQLQELFLTLLRALPRFVPEGRARLTTWVFAVAHRQLIAGRRKARLTLVPMEECAAVPDAGPALDVLLGNKRLGVALEEAPAKLPPAHRRVFVLTQLHHQPMESVAEVEGVPLGTVKSGLHRARAELVVLLGPALDVPEGGRHAANK
jgi:RNA polymerase sigma-70 factor, ECF subfamily